MTKFLGKFNRRQTLFILAILGPGIISGFSDNDAPGITTYSLAGAHFGYSLLWILVVTTFQLALMQELGARMGIVTGKGLSSLIREHFGLRWVAFAMAILFIANIGTTAAEFAGLAAALSIFHIPHLVTIPLAAVIIFVVLTRFDFRKAEILFLFVSFLYFVYVISGIKAHPDWFSAITSTIFPQAQMSKEFILMAVAVVGTTITPWGQFFIQSFVVDKKLALEHLKYERWDVFLGAFLTNFIAFFIIIATASTIWANGLRIDNVADAARALAPVAGNFASILFALGLLNAALFGIAIIPMSTAYVISEGFGWEAGIDKSFSQATAFYILIAISIFMGVFIVFLPASQLINILFFSQVINGTLLPIILIFAAILARNKEIMGSHRNKGWTDVLTFATIGTLSALSLLTAFSFLF